MVCEKCGDRTNACGCGSFDLVGFLNTYREGQREAAARSGPSSDYGHYGHYDEPVPEAWQPRPLPPPANPAWQPDPDEAAWATAPPPSYTFPSPPSYSGPPATTSSRSPNRVFPVIGAAVALIVGIGYWTHATQRTPSARPALPSATPALPSGSIAPNSPTEPGDLTVPTSPATPTATTTLEPAVTQTTDSPTSSVTPSEAHDVALQLWNENADARANRDIASLQELNAQPELEANVGYVCLWGCRGPELQSSTALVTVPHETTWPAYFFATVPYTTNCTASISPCDDSFVATQAAPHAEWKITLLVSWSGQSWATTPPVSDAEYSPSATPAPGEHVTTLPQEYADYLQSIKVSGQPPAGTRLAPGPFTTDLIASYYDPVSEQATNGAFEKVSYSVDPSDRLWEFPGSGGTTAVCGTVRWVDHVTPPRGQVLTQTDEDHPWGNLADGAYSAVTMTGLHMVCFEVYSDPSKHIAVFGTWGDGVTSNGTAIAVVTNPA